MAKVKRFGCQHYERNLNFGLYIASLLLNCKTLKGATEIVHVHDITVTLCQNITIANRPFIDRLLRKINDFDTKESALSDLHDGVGSVCDQQKPGFYTEEDFTSLAGSSRLNNRRVVLFKTLMYLSICQMDLPKIITFKRFSFNIHLTYIFPFCRCEDLSFYPTRRIYRRNQLTTLARLARPRVRLKTVLGFYKRYPLVTTKTGV